MLIHSHWSSSAAVALFLGSLSKHRFRKSMPSCDNWSLDGNCGEFPCAILYMIAHSLSRVAHGRRPVAISRTTHPSDQMSTAPRRPPFRPSPLPLITSGDMYIGVPVIDFCLAGAGSTCSVLFCRAMTLAAPKSTNLITPLWSRRMSNEQLEEDLRRIGSQKLTFGLDISMSDTCLV